jgi:hypothetical protein
MVKAACTGLFLVEFLFDQRDHRRDSAVRIRAV